MGGAWRARRSLRAGAVRVSVPRSLARQVLQLADAAQTEAAAGGAPALLPAPVATAAVETAQLAAQTKEVSDTLTKEWGAAAEGNKRAIGKLIRDALGGQVDEAAMLDLETSLGSNLTLSRVFAHAVGKMAEPEAPEGAGRESGGAKQMTPAAATAWTVKQPCRSTRNARLPLARTVWSRARTSTVVPTAS